MCRSGMAPSVKSVGLNVPAALPRTSGMSSPRSRMASHPVEAGPEVEDSRVRGRTAARDACHAAAVQDRHRDLTSAPTSPAGSHGTHTSLPRRAPAIRTLSMPCHVRPHIHKLLHANSHSHQ